MKAELLRSLMLLREGVLFKVCSRDVSRMMAVWGSPVIFVARQPPAALATVGVNVAWLQLAGAVRRLTPVESGVTPLHSFTYRADIVLGPLRSLPWFSSTQTKEEDGLLAWRQGAVLVTFHGNRHMRGVSKMHDELKSPKRRLLKNMKNRNRQMRGVFQIHDEPKSPNGGGGVSKMIIHTHTYVYIYIYFYKHVDDDPGWPNEGQVEDLC